eukprot:c12742_g2_i3.p1 GENE.c12742_g2_i3~~c12742_g2_i3.p1  ORF type:complete len:323 (-),score=76.73 c12742_g2_i3:103-1071(-)
MGSPAEAFDHEIVFWGLELVNTEHRMRANSTTFLLTIGENPQKMTYNQQADLWNSPEFLHWKAHLIMPPQVPPATSPRYANTCLWFKLVLNNKLETPFEKRLPLSDELADLVKSWTKRVKDQGNSTYRLEFCKSFVLKPEYLGIVRNNPNDFKQIVCDRHPDRPRDQSKQTNSLMDYGLVWDTILVAKISKKVLNIKKKLNQPSRCLNVVTIQQQSNWTPNTNHNGNDNNMYVGEPTAATSSHHWQPQPQQQIHQNHSQQPFSSSDSGHLPGNFPNGIDSTMLDTHTSMVTSEDTATFVNMSCSEGDSHFATTPSFTLFPQV